MTRSDLMAEIRRANSTGHWSDLVLSTRRADDPETFHVIFALAIEQQSIDATVYDAARLLYEARLTCTVSCELAIEAMLPSWDISIEEVPWYLRDHFGVDHVRQALMNVRRRMSSNREQRVLDTIEYWLGCDSSNGG